MMEWLGMIFCLLGIIAFCFVMSFIMLSIITKGDRDE